MESTRVGPIEPDRLLEVVGLINEWRDEMPLIESGPDSRGYAAFVGDRIVGGYVLISIPMAFEIVSLSVDPAFRKQGLGRLMCMDALFRSGKRPLILTANDASVGFAKAVGFKIFGKRKQADGTMLTRLGWHAPRPSDEATKPGIARR